MELESLRKLTTLETNSVCNYGYSYNKKIDCYLNPLHLVRTKRYELLSFVLMPQGNLVKNHACGTIFVEYFCVFFGTGFYKQLQKHMLIVQISQKSI